MNGNFGYIQVPVAKRPGAQRVVGSDCLPIPAARMAIEWRAVCVPRKRQDAILWPQHPGEESYLRIEPLVDLSLHKPMQDEKKHHSCDDQRSADEYAGRQQKPSAERCSVKHQRSLSASR